MKVDKERNHFSLRPMFWKCLLPMLNAIEKCSTKTELFNGKRYTKKLYTKLQPQIPLYVYAQLRIVTPPCFREKPLYVKLTTFSAAQETKNETEPIVDPKRTSTINMRSRWTVFCLCQQLFAFTKFCMETRLSNILKTTNATKFIKTILENAYKVVLGTYNMVAPTQPVFLLRAVEF